jgi:hypothetical protein
VDVVGELYTSTLPRKLRLMVWQVLMDRMVLILVMLEVEQEEVFL